MVDLAIDDGVVAVEAVVEVGEDLDGDGLFVRGGGRGRGRRGWGLMWVGGAGGGDEDEVGEGEGGREEDGKGEKDYVTLVKGR